MSGEYKQAKILFNQCYELFGKWYGFDNSYTAQIQLELAEVHLEEGDLPSAEKHLNEAMKIFQDNNFANTHKCLEDLSELALKKAIRAQKSGDVQSYKNFIHQSRAYLKQALVVARALMPEDSPHLEKFLVKLKSLESLGS